MFMYVSVCGNECVSISVLGCVYEAGQSSLLDVDYES